MSSSIKASQMKSKYDRNNNFYLYLFQLKTAVDDSDGYFLYKCQSKRGKNLFIKVIQLFESF